MAKKRPPISFPEFEPKGVRTILCSREEIRAEQALLAARKQQKTEAPSPTPEQVPSPPPQRITHGESQPAGFDLNHKTEKMESIWFTEAESQALDSLKLKAVYGFKTSKIDIIRACFINGLAEEQENGEQSSLIQRLRPKKA
jgi:hypothetical protein